MHGVIVAGLGIAGATALGSALGLVVKQLPGRAFDIICSLAAGIMLYAAVVGLLVPACEVGSAGVVCCGVLCGAWFLDKMNRRLEGYLPRVSAERGCRRGLLLVLAIVVHHFPEGMAAGVSFGTGDGANTAAVCTGIALQNIPEAMMIVPSMSMAGAKRSVTAAAVIGSGAVELLGLCLGYAGVQLAAGLLPLLLAAAGGTMLFVVLSSMVSEDIYGILLGFCSMLWV